MAPALEATGGCICWPGLANLLGLAARSRGSPKLDPEPRGAGEELEAEKGQRQEAGRLDRFRSLSTVASLSDLCVVESEGPSAVACSLQLALGVIDPVQMLGFCLPRELLRLRAAAASLGGAEVLDDAAMRRLAESFLRLPACIGARSLQDAADTNNLDAMWAHLRRGVRPNDYDEHGCLAIHHIADRDNAKGYTMLVQAGADIHAPHCGLNIRVGWTALHFAAYAGSRDVLLLLLLQGVPVNEMDRCRRTALYYARSRGRESCRRILAKFGGVEDLHLVEPRHLREAQRVDDGAHMQGHARNRDEHQWDASADAADMYTEGAAIARQYSDGDGVGRRPEEEAPPVPRYIGPAGDSGPSLTAAAMAMPGFEW